MYKVVLTKEELIFLRLNLHTIRIDGDEEKELIIRVHEKLCKADTHYVSLRKQRATKKATESRVKKAKDKINNAINLLQLENKPITHYSIAQTSGVSFNTVKKHIPDIDIIGKID